MSNFDDLLDELDLDDEARQRIKAATDASPLRQQLAELKKENEQLKEVSGRAVETLKKTTFEKVGIKLDPAVLAVPETVNVTDEESVREWAKSTGLIQEAPEAPTPVETQTQVQQIAGASNGAGTPDGVSEQTIAAMKKAGSLEQMIEIAKATGWGGQSSRG